MFLGLLYYSLEVLEIQNLALLLTVLVSFIILSGVFVSKLAVDPLSEYVKNLQNLSKETLHELNLPISTITTNLQMLEKNMSDEKSLKRVARIETACSMLKQRYSELDYLIKMQSMQETQEEFSLDLLVEERVHFLQRIYPSMRFKMQLNASQIYSDKIGLCKVIDNIIDNGVKYSKNSDLIEIFLDNKTLKIKDYGIGMDEVELVKIFDNYYDWIEETMTPEKEPYLQVIAVLCGDEA